MVNLLSKRFGYDSLFEEFENNPFLTDFYKDIKNNAFPVEMFFLAERYKQLTSICNENGAKPKLVADYFFSKSKVFSSFTLQKVEIDLFNRFFEVIEQKVFLPDIVVYINRERDYLLKSIHERGRVYEKYVLPSYLDMVTEGYLNFFKTEKRFPIIIINSGNSNFYEGNVLEALIDKVFTKKWPNGLQSIDL